MNKTITAETRLNAIKSLCAERDRKERDRLEANRLNQLRREEDERERLQHTNSILNSYIERAQERERQQSQEHDKMWQNIHDESVKRKSEEANRAKDMVSAVNRSIRNAEKKEEDSKSWDAFMDRNKRLLDKGIEAVKRERAKTYFS